MLLPPPHPPPAKAALQKCHHCTSQTARPPVAPSLGPFFKPPRNHQATPRRAHYPWHMDASPHPGPRANCPSIRDLDRSASSWSLKGLSGEGGESARPWTLPLRNGQGVYRPTWVWRARASKKGIVSSRLDTHQTLAPRHVLMARGQRQKRGLDHQPRGVPPTGTGPPVGAGVTGLRPTTELFSPFLEWEAHCEAPRTQGALFHRQVLPCTHTDTHSGRQPQARGGHGLGNPTHGRWHYRSGEDPLKPQVGLLRGAQPDLGGSSCLEVKPPLVLAPERWGHRMPSC